MQDVSHVPTDTFHALGALDSKPSNFVDRPTLEPTENIANRPNNYLA